MTEQACVEGADFAPGSYPCPTRRRSRHGRVAQWLKCQSEWPGLRRHAGAAFAR